MTQNHRQQGRRPERREPQLGDLDLLERSPHGEDQLRRRARMPSRQSRRRRWPWVVLVVVLLLVAGAWTQRASIRSWLPQTRFNQLLTQADQALAAGKLDGHQGDSARELYSAARTLRPEDSRAQDGLQKVGQAELVRAEQQLDAGKTGQAAESLKAARALLGGGEQLDRLDARLATLQARSDKLESLIQRAGQALADGNLDGRNGAAALYRQALLADPGNAIARHGLDKVGQAMATQIGAELKDGRLKEAAGQLDRLARLLPDFSGLPQLRADLSQARSNATQAQQQLLQQAAVDLAAGRLRGSTGDNALARYREVLQADPDNAAARKGVLEVASGLLARANARMDDGRLDEAGQLLDEVAHLVGSDVPQLSRARQRLADLRQQPAPLTAEQKAKVQRLVTRAQAAADSGHLMLPPGNSAYDLYRSALAIDADNSDAMAGLASLPGQARSLFDQALAQHDTARAAKLLDAFSQLAPGSSALPEMRSRLAAAKNR